ncbi:MAG: tyrosine-type recombinase/integrase [Christensenellales bacterium]|jgi:integrase
MHEHFENRRREGEFAFDFEIEEFSMAKIKRLYTINGVKLWLTGDSEQEIADKYAELKNGSRSGEPIRESKHNFEKFSKDNWQYISQTVSEITASDYWYYMEKDILPHFGRMNVEDIDWRSIQAFYDKLSRYSWSTIHKRKIVLSRILQIAVGDNIIPTDPTRDSRLTHSKKKAQRPVPGEHEFKRILDDAKRLEHQHERLYIALLGYTGLRKGEVLALRWDDIDFINNKIHISRAVQTRKTNKAMRGQIKEPKTEAGKRTVPLVKPLKEILLDNRHQYEFIITDAQTQEPIHTDAKFNTMWRSIKRQIDLADYTSHSFRHAVCSTLLSSGVDIRTTQAIIGHSHASTTLDIYAHAMPSKIAEAGLLFTGKITT